MAATIFWTLAWRLALPAFFMRSLPPPTRSGSRYRPWAERMKRTFSLDVLACPSCGGRLRLVALVTDPQSTRRFLRGLGEPTEAPARQPARGPPYWQEPRAATRGR